ncbi:MAG: hypothetical protein FWB73_05530, partial [Treponema sp.]|nr:hypothetical protein [Treponema sp.]
MKTVFTIFIPCILLLIFACPAAENNIIQSPVDNISIQVNKNPVPSEGITILEGKAVILEAKLSPNGVNGGIHWQTSNGAVVEMSGLTGQEITVTGKSGGSTIIFVAARNTFNELTVQSECRV